jgi:hypothetical protein
MAFSEQNGPDFTYTVEQVGRPSRLPDLLTASSAQFRSFYIYTCLQPSHTPILKGLSHEIDFKNFDKNLQNLV